MQVRFRLIKKFRHILCHAHFNKSDWLRNIFQPIKTLKAKIFLIVNIALNINVFVNMASTYYRAKWNSLSCRIIPIIKCMHWENTIYYQWQPLQGDSLLLDLYGFATSAAARSSFLICDLEADAMTSCLTYLRRQQPQQKQQQQCFRYKLMPFPREFEPYLDFIWKRCIGSEDLTDYDSHLGSEVRRIRNQRPIRSSSSSS